MRDHIDDLIADLAKRYGPFLLQTSKPFSLTACQASRRLLLKIYRGVRPHSRQARERDALDYLASTDIAAPHTVESGHTVAVAWILLERVPGMPCNLATDGRVRDYLHRAQELVNKLHRTGPVDGCGPGWHTAVARRPADLHLADQLTRPARHQPWWPHLAGHLSELNPLPAMRLHGDIKPEHLLVSPRTTHVVDWEACATGPAVCDRADIAFHAVRDLAYADQRPDTVIETTPTSEAQLAPMLAWRLALWADRRRPADLGLLTTDILHRVCCAPNPPAAVRQLAIAVTQMRNAGTPQ
jgi:Ser/Thr protein kinase RdoA (MazF antagonist)